MSLEKKYFLEKQMEVYEDEIDLKELFLILWRNKIKILVTVFIGIIIGFSIGQISSVKSKKSSVVVEYSYSGIESGKSPNGNTLGLTYNQFKNIFMIKEIFYKMPELKELGLSEDNILNAIKINPILPSTLKEGEVYYPNKFQYTLKIADSKEKDEAILKNFIEIQKNYFKRNYILNSQLSILNNEELSNYDYRDVLSVINKTLNKTIGLIGDIEKDFVSLDDKMEIQNILKELEILRDINILRINNLIEDYRVTRNQESLMISYRQELLRLEKERDKILGKIAQLESMIKTYKPENKNVVIMGSNSNSEKIKLNEENYYTEFLKQLATEKIELSNIEISIKYINKKLSQKVNTDSLKDTMVIKELEIMISNLNKNIKHINDLVIKNFNRKYSNITTIIEPVATKSTERVFPITLIGMILGLFVGVSYVLIKNFLFEEKRK